MEIPQQWVEHDQRVKPYIWSHRWVGIASSIFNLAVLIFFVTSGAAELVSSWAVQKTEFIFLQWLLYFGFVGLLWRMLNFPFSYADYRVERKFKLSKQLFGSWLGDQLKGLLVGTIIGAIVLGLLCLCVRYFGEIWWVPSCLFLVLFSIVLAQLAPVILIPLFFKLKPMDAGPLKERLMKLCQGFGVEVKDVYHLGMGEKTEKGNAAFVGLGKTKRIMIGDTLYEKFGEEEVEAVFAHELGHQVHNDLWKSILLGAVFLFISFFVAQWVSHGFVFDYFFTEIEAPLGMFMFFIVLSLVQKPMGVLQAAYSRSREWAADGFAQDKIGQGGKLADALERLTLQNRSYFKPNGVIEFLTYSHPAPWRRILALRGVR